MANRVGGEDPRKVVFYQPYGRPVCHSPNDLAGEWAMIKFEQWTDKPLSDQDFRGCQELAARLDRLDNLDGSKRISAKAFNKEIDATEALIAILAEKFIISGFSLPERREEP